MIPARMSHAWGPTLLPSGKLGVSGASPVVEDELRGKRFPSGRRGGWEVNSAVQYALRLSTRVHLPQHIGKQMKLVQTFNSPSGVVVYLQQRHREPHVRFKLRARQ